MSAGTKPLVRLFALVFRRFVAWTLAQDVGCDVSNRSSSTVAFVACLEGLGDALWNVANMRIWKMGARNVEPKLSDTCPNTPPGSIALASDHRWLVGAAAPRHGRCLLARAP